MESEILRGHSPWAIAWIIEVSSLEFGFWRAGGVQGQCVVGVSRLNY